LAGAPRFGIVGASNAGAFLNEAPPVEMSHCLRHALLKVPNTVAPD
jgi:hypothetical protein